MYVDRVINRIEHALHDALRACRRQDYDAAANGPLGGIVDRCVAALSEDLAAFAARDPASHGETQVILDGYASFAAVLNYRLAHEFWCCESLDLAPRMALAHRLSSRGKLLSGADIHPAARIGARFILDHGFGTVIGETCRIGDDCYILNHVTLGANGLADNPDGVRHPTIGHNVEIGGHVRILGPITVGDDVFVSPLCLIRSDVPAGTKVRLLNQIQFEARRGTARRGYLSAFASRQKVYIVGNDAERFAVKIVDDEFREAQGLNLLCTGLSPSHAEYTVRPTEQGAVAPTAKVNLRLSRDDDVLYLIHPPGLAELLMQSCSTHGGGL